MFKKIISSFLAFATVLSLTCPVFAYDSSMSNATTGDIWAMALEKYADSSSGYGSMLLSSLAGLVAGSDIVCPTSSDNLHHGDAKSFQPSSGNGRSLGVVCTCDYCGLDFTVSVSSDELNTAYNSYVSDLPAPGFDSDGSILIPITDWSIVNKPDSSSIVFDSAYPSLSALGSDGDGFKLGASFSVPFSGTYKVVFPSVSCDYLYRLDWWRIQYFTSESSSSDLYSSKYILPSNGFLSSFESSVFSFSSDWHHCYFDFYLYYANCLNKFLTFNPSDHIYLKSVSLQSLPDVYVDSSRTGSLAGNYGYYGDNGEFLVAENIQIVNETDNSFYNPVTNTTENITDWTYDYSTRSYNLTLDSGEQQTVTYGDEYVTINEGDTVYNIYYTLPEQDTPVEDCQHEYSSAVTRDPSCTVPGVTTYTCSNCSHSYTESIPALGHTWEVKQQVQTEYDENGELLKSGYIIYRCSVCGEEYKDSDGAGPPADSGSGSGSSDSGGGGLLDWIKDIIGDGLKKLFESLINGLTKTIDFIFGGDSQSDSDFYNSPSTFSGVSVWA